MEHRPFQDFYEQEFGPVLAYAFATCGDRMRAEELTQDAFESALRAWERIDNPAAWVRRVVLNKARSAFRRKDAERRAAGSVYSAVGYVQELPVETEHFWSAVRELPKRQAQVLTLFYLEDLSTVEISRILGCKESTARAHLTRGRRGLAETLEVEHD